MVPSASTSRNFAKGCEHAFGHNKGQTQQKLQFLIKWSFGLHFLEHAGAQGRGGKLALLREFNRKATMSVVGSLRSVRRMSFKTASKAAVISRISSGPNIPRFAAKVRIGTTRPRNARRSSYSIVVTFNGRGRLGRNMKRAGRQP